MQIWRIYWTLFWLLILTYIVLGYYLDQCPSPYQRNLRAKVICSESPANYSCLYDVEQKNYRESCSRKVDYVKPGYRYVNKGELAYGNCSDESYQPIKFWSNRSSKCEFLKNKCNELGQVIDSNRLSTKDRACRCDYTKGFDFVFQPNNTCYCIPSEEDCSCYQRTCSSGAELTQDYKCISKVNLEDQHPKCGPIVETRRPFIGNSSTSIIEKLRQMFTRDQNLKIALTVIIVTIIVGIFIAYCVCIQMRKDNQVEQNHPINIITANRVFLVGEMDSGVGLKMAKATYNDNYSKTNDKYLSREEKAINICDLLEKEPPKILGTFYKVLKKMKMYHALTRLKAWDRIFRYKNAEILKNMISHYSGHIVGCLLSKKGLDMDFILCLKESHIIQQNIKDLCEELECGTDEKKLSELINMIVEDGLSSMLQLVFALYISGETTYETMLLLTQADYNRYKKQ